MPIRRFLEQGQFTPEQRRVLELAFNATLSKLDLVDRNDPICEIVAQKVIDVEASGVTGAMAISEIAFKQLDPR
jgi:hypothetical protein